MSLLLYWLNIDSIYSSSFFSIFYSSFFSIYLFSDSIFSCVWRISAVGARTRVTTRTPVSGCCHASPTTTTTASSASSTMTKISSNSTTCTKIRINWSIKPVSGDQHALTAAPVMDRRWLITSCSMRTENAPAAPAASVRLPMAVSRTETLTTLLRFDQKIPTVSQ